MAEIDEPALREKNPWRVVAIVSTVGTLAAAACTLLAVQKVAEKDELLQEQRMAHVQIGIVLSQQDIIATQLQVDPMRDEYSFIALKTPETLLCEGTYDYSDGMITVKFGELACGEASVNKISTIPYNTEGRLA